MKSIVAKKKALIASLLLLYILLIQLATTSPVLHSFLHGSSKKETTTSCCHHEQPEDDESNTKSEHTCAVTLMASGVVPLFQVLTHSIPVFEKELFTSAVSALAPTVFVYQPKARDPPYRVT